MGKRTRTRKRGSGSPVYVAPSHRYIADVRHRRYDKIEKESMLKGKIVDLVKCPGHTAPLAKVVYDNEEEAYVIAPNEIKVGDTIETGIKSNLNKGSILPLKQIPEGTLIYNIESFPGDGGKFCRAAGTFSKIVSIRDNFVLVQLPSKKEKKFNPACRAAIGIISGAGRTEKYIVKAGKQHHIMRARGKYWPRTSGVAMNAVNHPFGSGRGRAHSKIKVVARGTPPGRKVGKVAARRTGRK